MRINSILTAVFSLICIVFFIAACGSTTGEDDDSIDDDTQNEVNPCQETTSILASIDEISVLLGISAADLLTTAGNGFTTTGLYSEGSSYMEQSPSGGETNLTVTISDDNGEIREIKSQPLQGQNDIFGECLSRLEIDVSVAFSTDDGAFNESWPAVLTQSKFADQNVLGNPNLTAQFDFTSFEGNFNISYSITGETLVSLTGVLSTTAVDPYQGNINLLVEQTHSESGDGTTISTDIYTALAWGASR